MGIVRWTIGTTIHPAGVNGSGGGHAVSVSDAKPRGRRRRSFRSRIRPGGITHPLISRRRVDCWSHSSATTVRSCCTYSTASSRSRTNTRSVVSQRSQSVPTTWLPIRKMGLSSWPISPAREALASRTSTMSPGGGDPVRRRLYAGLLPCTARTGSCTTGVNSTRVDPSTPHTAVSSRSRRARHRDRPLRRDGGAPGGPALAGRAASEHGLQHEVEAGP